MQNERDRLVELMAEICEINSLDNGEFIETDVNWNDIADHLIEKGVILLPCKVGDILYCVDELPKVLKCKVNEIDILDNAIVIRVGREGFFAKAYTSDDIGKRLFLTREAAEEALKEKNNGR